MLSLQTVVPHTLELIKGLMDKPSLKETRLVGGTSLALQYGHRSSDDIDLFGHIDCSLANLAHELQDIGEVTPVKESPNIKMLYLDGVKVDVVNYDYYDWIDDAIVEEGIRMASPKDIAAMKINAIQGRGSRKDFVDMYFLLQHYSLQEILGFYEKKYPNFSIFRALMSPTYFEDAEKQEMPVMHTEIAWEQMKKCICKAVKQYKQP